MKDVDLQYEPKSFAGSFVPGELKEFEGWFRESSKKRKGFAFDPSYVAHVKKYNGGIPGKPYFRTAKGTPHVVERFLNFADMKNSGVLAEYHVGAVWTSIEERLVRVSCSVCGTLFWRFPLFRLRGRRPSEGRCLVP